MGGVCQSTALCDRGPFPNDAFIRTNAAELVALLHAINGVYTLSMRGRVPLADVPDEHEENTRRRKSKMKAQSQNRASSFDKGLNPMTSDTELSEKGAQFTLSDEGNSDSPDSKRGGRAVIARLDEVNVEDYERKGSEMNSRRNGSSVLLDSVDDASQNDDEGEDGPGKFTEEEIEQLFEPFKHIYLANHYIGDMGIIRGKVEHDALGVMAKNKYLRTLDLSFNFLTENTILSVMDVLRGMPYFRHLSLGGNPIGHQGCVHVADFLAEDPPLEVLSLFHCSLTDEDCLTLLNGLRFNTHLKLLNVDFNYCTWKFVYSLIELVRDHNSTLAVVLFESVPHDPLTLQVIPQDTVTKIEYPCTPAGFFRSFQTYYNPEGMNETEQKAAAERFLLRRLVCRMDFTGLQPFPPSLLLELEHYLSPRRDAYVAELDEYRDMKLKEDMRNVIGSRKSDGDLLRGLEAAGHEGQKPYTQKGGAEVGEDGGRLPGYGPSGFLKDGQSDDSTLARRPQKPSGASASRSSGYRSSRHQGSGFSGCLRRLLPPLNSPQRLQMVMNEAYQFRKKLYGSPPALIGEKVLPNGFDHVWMAPLAQVGTKSANYVVNDKPSFLHACWCDPHDAASPYAGQLHYHCKREEYIDYSQSMTAKATKKNAHARESGSETGSRDSANAADGGAKNMRHGHPLRKLHRSRGSRSNLSPTSPPQASSGVFAVASRGKGTVETNPASRPLEGRAAHRHAAKQGSRGSSDSRSSLDSNDVVELGNREQTRQPYHGCQGTGHRCVSMKLPSGTTAGGSSSKLPQAGGPPREKVIHTNKDGLTMALHYSPVTYFSSPYQPEAAIKESS